MGNCATNTKYVDSSVCKIMDGKCTRIYSGEMIGITPKKRREIKFLIYGIKASNNGLISPKDWLCMNLLNQQLTIEYKTCNSDTNKVVIYVKGESQSINDLMIEKGIARAMY